ncbi:MAG: zinc ribbon domain-containing protein [Anaerolineae bacterium]|nr:zinc ribbon domain-containing protein [Anaerolineae bacterium]
MGKKVINGLLLLGIVGLLLVYFFTVNDLSGRIYTNEQQEYLSYNSSRSISQVAPTLNLVMPEGMVGDLDIPTLIPNSDSRVRATLDARYEEQQGVGVTVYDLEFQGEYLLTGPALSDVDVELVFPFPGNLETLHDVRFTVDDVEPADASYTTRAISWRTTLRSGDTHQVDISYKANGASNFAYGLPRDQRSQIDVVVTVAGLKGSSVPRTSLPTTDTGSTGDGETFTWDYTGLIANRDIQITLPSQLSFAQRIALLQDDFQAMAGLAPFLVGLFVMCLAGLFSLKGLRMPLEGYLLAGLGLALFYPLLTFTSGMIGIVPAAMVTLAVISGLLFVFLGLTAGWKKTWRPVGLLLLVFAGFFSLGMLTPWRDLSLTCGGLLLLATFMWAYARRPVDVRSALGSEADTLPEQSADRDDALTSAQPATVYGYCMHCGQTLEDSYTFCPGCGHDTREIRRCRHCDHQQYVLPEAESVYCVQCGNRMSQG